MKSKLQNMMEHFVKADNSDWQNGFAAGRAHQAKLDMEAVALSQKAIMQFPEVGIGLKDIDPLFINKAMRLVQNDLRSVAPKE